MRTLWGGHARALGGGPLCGDRMMRLVYVDEAGVSNRRQEPILVVAGVIVHGDKQLRGVMRRLDILMERHIPSEHWADFSFHATHLFNWGGPVFTKNHPDWPLERRLEVADDIAAMFKKFDLWVTYGSVERTNFPRRLDASNMSEREITIGAHVTAYMVCALNVDHWFRQKTNDEICLMVVEDNQQVRRFLKETHKYNQRRDIIEELNENEKTFLPLKRIVEDPFFQPKHKSSALQLADFCAYVIKRKLMGDSRYDRFYGPISERMTRIDHPAEKRKPSRKRRKRRK